MTAADGAGGDAVAGHGRSRRDVERAFWRQIAEGLRARTRRDAVGRVAGGRRPVVPRAVAGCRRSVWTRSRAGTCRLRSARRSRCCAPQDVGVREIARAAGRAPSTISRELRRNAATRGGQLEYRASTAQWHAERRARRPKAAKLAANERLREYVQERLAGAVHRAGRRRGRRAATVRVDRPPPRPPRRTGAGPRRGARSRSPTGCGSTSPMMSRCGSRHEAIYQALYVQGRGALRRELAACLRTGRALRVPAGPRARPRQAASSPPRS